MADFTITISNSVNTFGPAPSSKWNAWAWNAFRWGEGTHDLTVAFDKVIGNSLVPTDAFSAETAFVVSIANTLAPTADMGSEQLADAAGYTYIFPSNASDAENRDIPDWTSGTAGSPSWSSGTAGSTSWS